MKRVVLVIESLNEVALNERVALELAKRIAFDEAIAVKIVAEPTDKLELLATVDRNARVTYP